MVDFLEKLSKGDNPSRPPHFGERFFTQWKQNMEMFIKSHCFPVWLVISNGDAHVIESVGIEIRDKPFEHWTIDQFKRMENNYTTCHLILYGLNVVEQKRYVGYLSVKEMWHLLKITHEGTYEVKESKVDLLMIQYEQFSKRIEEDVKKHVHPVL